MKIVVIGGTGLIGSKLVQLLAEQGHEPVAASPNTGVNTLTGEGLDAALQGAAVVVDVSNSSSLDEETATNFFTTSTRNLLLAGAAAGVRHHVALSVVGTEQLAQDRPSDIKPNVRGYFRAKLAQERLIKESTIPYSIVHATQFFEFLKSIADTSTQDKTVHVAPALVQPMAADDVAKAVGRIAVGPPVNAIVEVAGPQQFRLDELIRRILRARSDTREVVADPRAGYFAAEVDERTLVPVSGAQLGAIRLEDWLTQPALAK